MHRKQKLKEDVIDKTEYVKKSIYRNSYDELANKVKTFTNKAPCCNFENNGITV